MIQTKSELLQVVITEPITWCHAFSIQSYLKADREVAMGLGSRLTRFAIVEDLNQVHFCLTIHHATYDGWSMGLMLQQVEQAYEGMHISKTPRFSTFIGFVLSQMTHDKTKEFWQSELVDSTPESFRGFRPKYTYQGLTILWRSRLSSSGSHVRTSLRRPSSKPRGL